MTRFNKKHTLSVVVSVAVSVLGVALVASATTYIDTSSVGVASSTVGAAVAVKGAAIFEGFVAADYYTSTSTNSSWILGNLGLGTTTPGPRLGLNGSIDANSIIAENNIKTSYLVATSTTATSTIGYGLTINSTSLVADANSSSLGIGTSTFPVSSTGVKATISVGGGSATSTLYLAGGANVGSSIILKSADGNRCVEITANASDADAELAVPLTVRVVACPRP